MSPVSKDTYRDWYNEQLKDPEFVAALNEINKAHWNYRVIKHESFYGLHEVFYNDDGSIFTWTVEPTLVGDSINEIIEDIKQIMDDLKRFPEPLIKSELKPNLKN